MAGIVADRLLRIVLGISLAAAVALTLAVARGWTDALDRGLMRRLPAWHAPDRAPTRLETVARDLSALGGDTLRALFLLACMLLLAAGGRGRTAWLLLGAFASARVALLALKRLVRRPRPDVGGHRVVTYTTSFPSGHTFMAAVLFVSAALMVPAAGPRSVVAAAFALALAISLAIGVMRLALRIHWPSDVAVGWLAGIAWGTAWALAVAP